MGEEGEEGEEGGDGISEGDLFDDPKYASSLLDRRNNEENQC